MTNPLIALTRELLDNGVFNHLPDNEIRRLSWMITQENNSDNDSHVPVHVLFSYWYRGDYYSSSSSPRLLQRCNEYLQRLGQPLVDVYGEELYEA